MHDDTAVRHPRLFAKCKELIDQERRKRGHHHGDDAAARMLASLVVLTANSEGRAEVEMTDMGDVYRLPRHIRRMRLHLLMEARE